jgi:HIV Tat-specific factor 1
MKKYNNNDKNNRDRPSKAARRQGGPRGPPQPKQNTAVYVTGLPLDATAEEVAEVFSRKCGVIAEEIDSGRPRIKMYTDAEGRFKGDALIVFFKPQSVDMAIMLLDDTDLRFPEDSGTKMHVQAADMSYKKTKYHEDPDAAGAGNAGQPQGREDAPPPRRSEQDKAKIIRKTQKLAAKLSNWSDDDEPTHLHNLHQNKKASRTVILKHMFTLEELAEDPTALLDIKEEIRDECAKLGTVTNVILYDEEPEGIVSVRFKTKEAAEQCVKVMHGRAFDGRYVEASIATGRERFKRSKGEVGKGEGSDDGGD